MRRNQINTATYASLVGYKSVKNIASSNEKDILIEALIKIAVDHDLNDCDTPVSELNALAVDKWVSTEEQKNTCYTSIENFNVLLTSLFPDAAGKIEPSEIRLLAALSQNPDVFQVKAAKDSKESTLELWIICMKNKYSVLEMASDLISNYIAENHADVNFVVISQDQLTDKGLPDFIISL